MFSLLTEVNSQSKARTL